MEEQEKLQELLKSIGKENTQEELKNNLAKLQVSAKNFLKVVDQYVNLEDSLDFHFYKNGNVALSYTTIYEIIKAKNDGIKRLIAAQEDFQMAKNEANNITMLLAYFDIDKNKIIISSQQTMSNFFKEYATSSSTGSRSNISVNSKRAKKLLQENDDYKKIQNILNQRSLAYMNILNETFKRWKKEDMNYKKENSKEKNTFYWRPYVGTENWHYIHWSKRYGSRGYIAEGYVAALINDAFHQGYFEDNIEILNDYTSQTSNKGASKEQDIVINFNNKRIQIAVKSSNSFSTANLGQFIQEAFNIVGLEISEENNDFLVRNIKYKSVIEQILQEKRQDALDKIIEKIRNFSN